MAKPVEITDQNFEEVVLNSDKPVLIDFWATWCGPCRAIAPIIEAMAVEYEGEAIIGKMDVDANPEISQKFRVMNIPTLLVFSKGEEVARQVGLTSKGNLDKLIATQIAAA